MNKEILNTGVQHFINKNIDTDIVSVLLKKSIFEGISTKELAQQIESKKKCQNKLPTWFKTSGIYYPKKVNIEQTSSEITATYKSSLVDGKSLLDVTGGFGIDSFYFSKKINLINHCEIDQNLHEIASYNFKILDANNIQTFAEDGLDFLKNSKQHFDWLYLDPSRRNKSKGKVFLLSDCQPQIIENLELLFSKTENILIKTSPLLDISSGIKELNCVKALHIVSIKNEVKELLWVLKKEYKGAIHIKTINFTATEPQKFNFTYSEEKNTISKFSLPKLYLYEPNASILKSGAFKQVGFKLNLEKLHQHTHLYTSEGLLPFPGRRFKLLKLALYNKSGMKELNIKKGNITVRNFPETVANIREKFKIKDGGNLFLFFFKNIDEVNQVALCHKI